MKTILSYQKFQMLKEAEENAENTSPDATTGEENGNGKTVPTSEDGVEIEKRNSAVVLKEFFNELKTHVTYWFQYGDIKDMLQADPKDITLEKRGLCIWAVETNDKGDDKYQWRIKFVEADIEGLIEKVEKVKLLLDIFDWNREYLIKRKEIIIDLNKISENFLINKIKKVKSTIIKIPKDKEAVKKFKNRETKMLGDNIY